MGGGIAFGCEAGGGFEYAVEVKRAQSGGVGQLIERRQRLGRFDLAAGGCYGRGMLCGDFTLILAGALARPVTRCLGLFGGVEKLDILRLRQACEAAWAAIDAGGFDRIDKLPVCPRVPGNHGGPAWIVFDVKGGRKRFHER